MPDVPSLPQSVLQTPQLERLQDMQQRQVTMDSRLAGQQLARRVDERRGQVKDAARIESDPLTDDAENPAGDGRRGDEDPETQPGAIPPGEPDLGTTIDFKA